MEVLDMGGGVNYEARDHWWIRLHYQHQHHLGGLIPTMPSGNPFLFANHNRVTVSVERNFNLPIGR